MGWTNNRGEVYNHPTSYSSCNLYLIVSLVDRFKMIYFKVFDAVSAVIHEVSKVTVYWQSDVLSAGGILSWRKGLEE